MVSKKLIIDNGMGLHARPAAALVGEAKGFSSEILLVAEGMELDAKNVFELVAAAIPNGAEVELICRGDDEEEALDYLVKLIESGLGE